MTTPRRRWLCVAYAFPPINRSGTHRTAAFVRHLHRQGWDADVISVQPEGESIDDDLLATVPDSVRVHRTSWTDLVALVKKPFRTTTAPNLSRHRPSPVHATSENRNVGCRQWCSRLLQTPDSRLGWVPFAVAAGVRCIHRNRPEVLYSTSPYASAHLAAWILHRMYRIPWVADFRDPWMGNPYADATFRSLTKWNGFLEHTVVRAASAVICNTPTLQASMVTRHPNAEEKCHTVANGIDADLLADTAPERTAPADTFVMLHAGQFYGPRKPAHLFEALRRAAERLPESRKVLLTLLGRETYEGRPLRELAESAGVGELVQVLGTRPHRQTLAHLAGADALVLMGSAGPGAELQVPNKLFEYLGAKKPILAAVDARSPNRDILRQSRAETALCDPGDVSSLTAGILDLLRGTHHRPTEPWSGVEKFDRARRADELRVIFESLAKSRRAIETRPLERTDRIATLHASREAFSCG